eukprot:SAG11_NODE_467_length_9212_cov_2.153627_7_plen_185_part_00
MLDAVDAWQSPDGKDAWLTVDAGHVAQIAGIVAQPRAQGRLEEGWGVTKFTTQVSYDGKDWDYVDDKKIFLTNFSSSEREKHYHVHFREPVEGRYIRINAVEWEGQSVSLRCGLILIDKELYRMMKELCPSLKVLQLGSQIRYAFLLALSILTEKSKSRESRELHRSPSISSSSLCCAVALLPR